MIASTLIKIAIAVAAFGQGSFATTYAQFCNDYDCNDSCGTSVSVDNPGCLNESGRHSIKFHDANAQNVNLVFSPTPDCPCQNYCIENILAGSDFLYDIAGSCYRLESTPGAESFRFVGNLGGGSPCDPNNCS